MNNKNKFVLIATVAVTFFGLFAVIQAASELRRDERPLRPEIREEVERLSQADFRRDEIVVKLKGDQSFRRVRLSGTDTVESAIERFRSRADVLYAEPNYTAYAFFSPMIPTTLSSGILITQPMVELAPRRHGKFLTVPGLPLLL